MGTLRTHRCVLKLLKRKLLRNFVRTQRHACVLYTISWGAHFRHSLAPSARTLILLLLWKAHTYSIWCALQRKNACVSMLIKPAHLCDRARRRVSRTCARISDKTHALQRKIRTQGCSTWERDARRTPLLWLLHAHTRAHVHRGIKTERNSNGFVGNCFFGQVSVQKLHFVLV